nr:MAG TPA: hypothetical protein [Caudoviricetes sp.]
MGSGSAFKSSFLGGSLFFERVFKKALTVF